MALHSSPMEPTAWERFQQLSPKPERTTQPRRYRPPARQEPAPEPSAPMPRDIRGLGFRMADRQTWGQQDYYELFGIPRSANRAEINRAYRRYVKHIHPDLNFHDQSLRALGEERLKSANIAIETLRNAVERARYDAWLNKRGRASA